MKEGLRLTPEEAPVEDMEALKIAFKVLDSGFIVLLERIECLEEIQDALIKDTMVNSEFVTKEMLRSRLVSKKNYDKFMEKYKWDMKLLKDEKFKKSETAPPF